MYSRSGLPGQCLLVNPRGSCPEFPSIYPDPEMCHPEPWNQVGKISIHPNLQGRRLGSLPGHQPRLSRLIGSEGPPACLTQSSPSWAARPHLDVNVVLSPLTGPFCPPPPPPAVPSQPPENVRALSITSDVAVISWSEPPRSTLNGVLKGYRVIFWSLYVDGGESAGNVIGSQGERCGVGAGAGPHSVGAQHLPMGCQVEVQPLLRPCHSGPEPGSWGGRGGEGPSCS